MNEPELKFEIDEHGRIEYRVTNEGVLLSKDEKELIIDHVMRMQAENVKLRELAVLNWEWAHSCCGNNCKMQTDGCGYGIDRECNYEREIYDRMRELGIKLEGGDKA